MSILLEAMPFIVLGAVVAGLLEELLPQKLITRILPRSRFLSIAIGGLLGLLFPMCECGIIPVMRRLLRKGLPVSCCTAYLLAGPIINVVVMLSTYLAFDGQEKTPVPAGHGAADGRPVDDGPAHGRRLSRGHRHEPDRRLAVPQARQQAADAVGRAERLADGGRRRAGAAAAHRPTHHEHRANEPARFRGHHGLPDPRRPDRFA